MKRLLVAYFFFCFFFLAFFSSGVVDSQDGFQYLAIARRIYFDHTFEMPLEKFPDDNIPMSASEPVDGKYYSPTGLGYTLSLLPAVAVEDLFNRWAGVQPMTAFPLQNDWPVLLVASMTNAVWGALLAVALFLYLKELGLRHRYSLVTSFILVTGTNIFPYTKHTFAQMMFTCCLVWTFLAVKKYANTGRVSWLVAAGLWFGAMVISYNPTFLFVLPALGLYYLLLKKNVWQSKNWQLIGSTLLKDGLSMVLSSLPFLLLYLWFNQVRYGGTASTGYAGAANQLLSANFPAYVIIEGVWGLLFSPGKSIFLYSPLLLVLVFFWFKLSKKVLPEVVAAGVLFLTYLWFIGTLLGGVDFLVWHGDSSWGPRYLLPALPLLLVLVGYVVAKLSANQRALLVAPLFLAGLGINMLGMILPYQIRFAGLQTDAEFNGRNFNVYEYGNEIPRYAPAFTMAKIATKRLLRLRQLYDFGPFNLQLIDGFDRPFDVGWMIWRGVQPVSAIKFDQNPDYPITTLGLQFRNHQMELSSTQSAHFAFKLNGQALVLANNVPATAAAGEEKEFVFAVNPAQLQAKDNVLTFTSLFDSSTAAQLEERQAIFLQIARINGLPQNISSITYPYVSPVSKNIFGSQYFYWGGLQQKPWSIWHMHSGVYEQTFDFWWLRPLHYWDLPKSLFGGLFVTNLLGLASGGVLTWWWSRGLDRDGMILGQKLKIQLGSGKNHFKGWINTDIRPAKQDFGVDPDHYLDVTQPLPVKDGSVKYLYSEHLVEHLSQETNQKLFREAYRALDQGGVMRIATPDLATLVTKYQSKKWRQQDWLLWPEYQFIATPAEMLNVALRWWGHQYVFDYQELARLLKEAGFTKIKRVEWGKSQHLELKARETRPDSTLVVEATK
jgi:predicted SAM-dependent methyltransferase